MIGSHRTAGLALVSVCVLAWAVVPGRMAAEPLPVEVRTAQEVRPLVPEPPLADGVAPSPVPGSSGVIDPVIPMVTVRIRVPANATAGQELTCRIFVDNISKASAHHVAVRVSLPTNARLKTVNPEPKLQQPELRWEFGTIEACGSKEITLIVVPDGAGEVRTTARVSFEHGQTVVTRMNQPEIQIRKSGPAQAALNDTIGYQLEVTNTGSAEAADVVVADSLADGMRFLNSTPPGRGDRPQIWELGNLAPGRTRRIDYQVIVEKAGVLQNSAVVTAKGNLRHEATHRVTVGEAKLSVLKTGPAQRLVGRDAVFFITVSNPGTIPATNVEISDLLPQDIMLVNTTGGGRQVGNTLRWALGTLAPGGRATVKMTVRATKAGELVNVASVRADRFGPIHSETRTQFVKPAAVTIEIDKSGDPLEAGKEGSFTIRVLNPTSAPVMNLMLKVSGNETLKFVTSSGTTAGTLERDKPVIQFQALPLLAAGAEAAWTIKVETLAAGEAKLLVEMKADAPAVPLTVEENTTIWPIAAR